MSWQKNQGGRKMKCPSCMIEIMEIDLTGIKIKYCIKCEGIWLSENKLIYLLQNKKKFKKTINSLNKTSIDNRNYSCPECEEKMENLVSNQKNKSSDSKLIIDACPQKHGYWFEKGNLLKFIKRNNLDKNNQTINKFKNIFVN